MKKRILSLALTLTVAGNLCLTAIPNAHAEEIIIEDNSTESVLIQDAEPESAEPEGEDRKSTRLNSSHTS